MSLGSKSSSILRRSRRTRTLDAIARERIVIVVPDVRRDGSAVHDLVPVKDEELEEREFLGRELDRLAAATHLVAGQIHLEVGEAHRLEHRGIPPPRERFESRQQLAEGERLGEIVVGARLEA